MKASIDTDIVIHLYMSGKKDLIFSFFDKIYMHEYLYENELKRKSIMAYNSFSSDVAEGLVEIVTNKDLIEMGIKGLFDGYKRDYEYLFDMGELYAVSLAKAMGLVAFISDDTKNGGPHETLVKELIEDVIPFAFYELLFLRYVNAEVTLDVMQHEFEHVNLISMKQHPMNFRSKMLKTVRRFSRRNGTDRDYEWICGFCSQKGINYRYKMQELRNYLNE